MGWKATLDLRYQRAGAQVVAHHRHQGPLRILQSLYPEGPGICHNVLVHPPGGLVGGDTLELAVHAEPGTHGLITTPGATRFYRSEGEAATQQTRLHVDAGARLEWLPLEALCYSGCQAVNQLEFQLEEGAQLLGWDITALGLPHADAPFVAGSFTQHIEWPGVWLERGRLDATDTRLLDSPLGLDGMRCMASMFFASGTPWTRPAREQLLDAARAVAQGHALAARCGVTSPHEGLVLLRVLAPVVEPCMDLLRQVRHAWRGVAWELPAVQPRIWAM